MEIFNIVRDARDAGIKTVQDASPPSGRSQGWEVDHATREHIDATPATAQYFIHRTGHSIGTNVHGNGANMDNLETKDDADPAETCFSIEPGIYLPEFGVRSEVNVLIRNGAAEVTGKIQNETGAHLMANAEKHNGRASHSGRQPFTPMAALAPAIGWLIPGAGHLIQKKLDTRAAAAWRRRASCSFSAWPCRARSIRPTPATCWISWDSSATWARAGSTF